MPTSKSSGRASRSKASTARKASSTSRRTSPDAVREELARFLDPREVVVVTRERLQESLDEAVARGRMTRDDAATLLEMLGVELRLGAGSSAAVPEDIDLLVTSPGWPPNLPIFGQAAAQPYAHGAPALARQAREVLEGLADQLPEADRAAFLADLGLAEAGLDRIIRAGYGLLGLLTFFTAGPKEVRAWTVRAGATAPQAAGVIHTDFERGFIRAETIAYEDYIALGGESGARDAGKLRQEGKEYIVKDGDVMLFRFNV